MNIKIPKGVPPEQVSEQFLQGMTDRMSMGFFNYGPVSLNFPENYNALEGVKQRIKKYKQTKNTEWLMDAANFIMIEFMHPSLSNTFYEATTKRESPGSPLRNGKQSMGKEDFDPHTQRIKIEKKESTKEIGIELQGKGIENKIFALVVVGKKTYKLHIVQNVLR